VVRFVVRFVVRAGFGSWFVLGSVRGSCVAVRGSSGFGSWLVRGSSPLAFEGGPWQTSRMRRVSGRVPWIQALPVALGVVGCGPRVDEPQDWMLGVFSTQHPSLPGGNGGDIPTVFQFHVREDGTMDTYVSDRRDSNPPYGPIETQTWESRGPDELAFFSWPGDSVVVEVVVRRTGRCGPHPVRRVTELGAERESEWYRGSVCVWFGDNEPDCHGICRPWHFEWCDEPPEPCEDDD
jgi:hypothetical protein